MNERIKQLYQQAHEPQPPINGKTEQTKNILWGQPDKFNPEKFAVLIVKECADKCLAMAYVNPGPHHYAAMIKEHFGVEEC